MPRIKRPKYSPTPSLPQKPESAWMDISSYSRGDVDRPPKTVEIRFKDLRIVVTRHIDAPGKWILRCDPFYNMHVLESTELEEAKREALERVLFQVESLRMGLNKFLYPGQMEFS